MRFFKEVSCMAASMLLFAACSKQQSHQDLAVAENPPDLLVGQENIPVIASSSENFAKFNSIRQFSYQDFARKTVHLDSSLDFPVPIDFSLYSKGERHSDKLHVEAASLIYRGSLSIGKTVLFYGKQLKDAGWSYTNLSTPSEGLLVCSTKQRQVVVSVRRAGDSIEKTTEILLFFKKNISSPSS